MTPRPDIKGTKDFPSWLPALLVKELRWALRTRVFTFLMVGVPIALALFFNLGLIEDDYGEPIVTATTIKGIFWGIAFLCFIVLLPLRTLRFVRDELKSRTGDLLKLTHLSRDRIIVQKWISSVLETLLLVFLFFPFIVLQYFWGGVDVLMESAILLALLAGSVVLQSVGMWISSLPLVFHILWFIGMVLMTIGLVIYSIIFISMGNGHSLFPGLSGGIGFEGYVYIISGIVAIAAFIPCFLSLAGRALASTSDNVSLFLRKYVLILLMVNLLLTAIFFFWVPQWPHVISIFNVVLGQLFFFVLVIEMVVERPLCKAHLEKLGADYRGPVKWFRVLFLPGWPSAALFGLVAVCFIILSDFAKTQYYGSMESFFFNSGGRLHNIAGLFFVVYICSWLFRRIGVYALFMYAAITQMCKFIGFMLMLLNLPSLAGLVPFWSPVTNFMIHSSGIAQNLSHIGSLSEGDMGLFMVTTGLFIIIIFVLYLPLSHSYWKRYRNYKKDIMAVIPD